MLFSVGVAGALDGAADDVVVVVVVEDGAWLPLEPQAAVNVATAMSTAPPAAAIRRRSTCRVCTWPSFRMMLTPLVIAVNPRGCGRCRSRRYRRGEEVAAIRVDALLCGSGRGTCRRRSGGRRRGCCRGGRRRGLVTARAAASRQRTDRDQDDPARNGGQSLTINRTQIHLQLLCWALDHDSGVDRTALYCKPAGNVLPRC